MEHRQRPAQPGPGRPSRADRIFRRLLRLLPFEFRSDFGREMEGFFREQRRQTEARGGSRLRLWWRTLTDLARTAPREHADLLRQDFAYARRSLRRSPAFTLVAVATLALGLGANTVLFSVVRAVLLAPLPYPRPQELVALWSSNPAQGQPRFGVSVEDFHDWQRRSRTLAGLAAYQEASGSLTGIDRPERLVYAVISPELLALLGVAPALRRGLDPEEDRVGRDRVAVISHRLWQRTLGGDPAVLGRTLTLEGQPLEVVGVMPPGFAFPDPETDLYKPLGLHPDSEPTRGARWLGVVGRLAAGTSRRTAEAEMEGVAQALARDFPETNRGWGVVVEPLGELERSAVRPALFALWATVGLVLLIVCANLASLLLARATTRAQEMALRAALGARRARILRQLAAESLLLALLGGTAGLLLARWTLEGLPRLAAAWLPRLEVVRLDGAVLAFSAAASLAAGLLFGLAPALRTTRTDLAAALKQGEARGTAGRGSLRVRGLLVTAEVALALVVLTAAALLGRSFGRLLAADPGFEPERLLTLRIEPPWQAEAEGKSPEDYLAEILAERRSAEAFYRLLAERLEALPGVLSAAAVNRQPLAGNWWLVGFAVEGRPAASPAEDPGAFGRVVTPGYFETLRIPVVEGRALTAEDSAGALPVVVVDRTLARARWPGESPLGRRITFDDPGDEGTVWYTVVGVAGEVRCRRLDAEPQPTVYVPLGQAPFGFHRNWGMDVLVRTDADPRLLAGAVRESVRTLAPEVPVFRLQTMRELIRGQMAGRRASTWLSGSFAVLALLLAALGLYGVVAYSVALRRSEIGLRMALGADRGNVLALVLRQGMTLVAAGVAAGLAAAFALTRLLASQLYGVSPTDPLVLAGAALLLAAVAAAACAVPARQASRVDPATAFRSE